MPQRLNSTQAKGERRVTFGDSGRSANRDTDSARHQQKRVAGRSTIPMCFGAFRFPEGRQAR
jgi:hypothetical protein